MSKLLSQLSRADLERLLETKSEVEDLEARREELQKELTAVEKKLAALAGAALGKGRRKAKKTKKKAAKKKAAKKKATKKKATKKKATKTATKKKATRKKATKKKATRKAAKKVARKGGPKLEDVVVGLLEKKGGPMSFQDILATIVKRKLYATRSKQFDNVLRRTLSTSTRVKRISRGVYDL